MNEYDLAQFEIAQIQLNHKNDKKEYIQCYLNVANLRETSSAYFNLGMAYSHIFCLEDAKRAFGRALELDPTNEELAMKIGDFYVLTSQYKNALHVFCSYDGQVQNPLKIKIKLAHLYSITGQKDLALKIMEKIQQLPVELEYSNHEEQLYVFLKTAEIYCSLKDWEKTAANIEKGLEIQRMMIDDDAQGSSHEKKKELAAETAFHLSFCYFYQGQLKYSIESVQCAIELGPFHEKYSIALAKLLYKKFQFEECLEICCKHHEEHNIDISILVTKSLIALSRYDAAFIKSNTFFVNNIHNSVHYADTSKKFWIMISMHIYLLHILGEKSKIEDLCNQLDKKGSQNYGMMFCKVSV
jgi:tetratricopeptide (TPR) repeat protein